MFNIYEMLEKFPKMLHARSYDNKTIIISPPFVFLYGDETIALAIIPEEEENAFTISDLGSTYEYLNEYRKVDIGKYTGKLKKIEERYGVEHEENELEFKVKNVFYDPEQSHRFFQRIFDLIQAITLIAYIDLTSYNPDSISR